MFKVQELSKVHRAGDIETTALRSVNLEVVPGEFVAVMGPSGCGKTTLLNILGTLDTPTSGDYWIGDENVSRYSESRLARIRREHIGFIFQSYNLIEELSVSENIELALTYRGVSPAQRRRRVDEVMEKIGIAHRAEHRPAQLSGGQQQRVAIARAVVGRPSLILADEPTGNLDSHYGEEVMHSLEQLNADGTTIVMVTHSAEHAAFARRIVHLFDGEIINEHQRAA